MSLTWSVPRVSKRWPTGKAATHRMVTSLAHGGERARDRYEPKARDARRSRRRRRGAGRGRPRAAYWKISLNRFLMSADSFSM